MFDSVLGPERESCLSSEVSTSAWQAAGADRWDLSTRLHEPAGGELVLQPGRIVELSGGAGMGLTRLGYRMLAEWSNRAPVVAVDVRGWMSPAAAWEAGVERNNLVVVRCADHALWPQVVSALCEGVSAIYAEVPRGVREHDLRRLAALIRARQVRAALRPVRGELGGGIVHLRVRAVAVTWQGTEMGHGRLMGRHLVVELSGKGASGMTRRIELEDAGEDVVRVVSGVAAEARGRAV